MLGLALVLALKWSEDLENGRLELIFSTPQSWTRILLERFGANVLVLLPAPVLTWLAITIGAQLAHLSIFHLYGNPVFLGMNWGNFLGMTGVAVVLLMIGLIQFRSADIKLG